MKHNILCIQNDLLMYNDFVVQRLYTVQYTSLPNSCVYWKLYFPYTKCMINYTSNLTYLERSS